MRLVSVLILPFLLSLVPCAAAAGTATVMIGWNPSPDPVAGYEFCYGTSSGNYDYAVNVGNATSCSISGLEEGTTYYFAARAYDAAGLKSEFSEELVHTIPVSDPTTPPPIADETTIWIEAEDSDMKYPFDYGWDNDASSDGFIWAPNGSGTYLRSPSDNGGDAEYVFEVPEAGDYVIWGRVLAPNGRDNSFFVSVDGGAYGPWGVKRSSSWIWDQVNIRKGADPVIYYLAAGKHTLTIKQREDGTKLDKILITNDLEYRPEGMGGSSTPGPTPIPAPEPTPDPDSAPTPTPDFSKLWFEAESVTLTYPFESGGDSDASSGQFVWAPNGSGTYLSNPSDNGGDAEYVFDVPEAGDYVIWGRVLAPNGEDNSFFVSVDGGAYGPWGVKRSSSWIWDQVNIRNGVDPVIYYLKAGNHTLTIKQREDGTKLDKILITNDLGYVPEGPGE